MLKGIFINLQILCFAYNIFFREPHNLLSTLSKGANAVTLEYAPYTRVSWDLHQRIPRVQYLLRFGYGKSYKIAYQLAI